MLSLTRIQKPPDTQNWCNHNFPSSVLYPVTNQIANVGNKLTDSWQDTHQRGTQESWADARVQKSPGNEVQPRQLSGDWAPKPTFTGMITERSDFLGWVNSTLEDKRDKNLCKNISIQLASLDSLLPESVLFSHSILLASPLGSASRSDWH